MSSTVAWAWSPSRPAARPKMAVAMKCMTLIPSKNKTFILFKMGSSHSSYSVCGYGETKKQAARSVRSHLRYEWQDELYIEREDDDLYYVKLNDKRYYVKFYTRRAYPNGAVKAIVKVG